MTAGCGVEVFWVAAAGFACLLMTSSIIAPLILAAATASSSSSSSAALALCALVLIVELTGAFFACKLKSSASKVAIWLSVVNLNNKAS